MSTEWHTLHDYGKTALTAHDALIVVDMQYDFLPGGALPVAQGDTIIKPIASLMELFFNTGSAVICTQDWHPKGHRSFASAHGKNPYDPVHEPGIGPVLWPDHCVIGTPGAMIHEDIAIMCHAIIRKGHTHAVDSYSAFLENDKKTSTGLSGYLNIRGIRRIFVCGLAFDYCVHFSAVDGADAGFETVVITNCSKAVNSPADSARDAIARMTQHAVKFCLSSDVHA